MNFTLELLLYKIFIQYVVLFWLSKPQHIALIVYWATTLFSNFAKNGPSPGTDFSTNVYSISSSEMNISSDGQLQTWTRKSGTDGAIEGRWEHNDPDNDNTSIIIFDSKGSFMYSAYGDSWTKIIDVPKITISIDGNFSDWNQATRLSLYWTEGNCGGTPGREIREVYIAQDENYIYLRMKVKIRPQRGRLWKPLEGDTMPCLQRGQG